MMRVGSNVMRSRPNLFEVINREPQQQPPPRSLPGLSRWLRRTDSNNLPPIVAEPLTEEQATAELAAQHAAEEEALRAAEQAIQEKRARIEAKRFFFGRVLCGRKHPH